MPIMEIEHGTIYHHRKFKKDSFGDPDSERQVEAKYLRRSCTLEQIGSCRHACSSYVHSTESSTEIPMSTSVGLRVTMISVRAT